MFSSTVVRISAESPAVVSEIFMVLCGLPGKYWNNTALRLRLALPRPSFFSPLLILGYIVFDTGKIDKHPTNEDCEF